MSILDQSIKGTQTNSQNCNTNREISKNCILEGKSKKGSSMFGEEINSYKKKDYSKGKEDK